MSGALAIFVKTPGESPVKTRLAAACGEAYALEWYRLAAAAVASVARQVEAHRGLCAYWAVDGRVSAWPRLASLQQGPGGLAARMTRVHAMLVERHGFGLLLGADAPQISAALLENAAGWLDSSSPRLALGPAADGGFWLFGSNVVAPERLWNSVRYSVADTARSLEHSMQDLGCWRRLPTLRDADRAGDLDAVQHALEDLPAPTTEQSALAHWMRKHPPPTINARHRE